MMFMYVDWRQENLQLGQQLVQTTTTMTTTITIIVTLFRSKNKTDKQIKQTN